SLRFLSYHELDSLCTSRSAWSLVYKVERQRHVAVYVSRSWNLRAKRKPRHGRSDRIGASFLSYFVSDRTRNAGEIATFHGFVASPFSDSLAFARNQVR